MLMKVSAVSFAMVAGLCIVSGCINKPAPAGFSQTANSCILQTEYERGSDLSGRVWDCLRSKQREIIAEERELESSSIYFRGEGRLAFAYATECTAAQRQLAHLLDRLEAQAPDQQVARVLRQANSRWGEIDREEYEAVTVPRGG